MHVYKSLLNVEKVDKIKKVISLTKNERKTIGIRIKSKDLPLFNRRLVLMDLKRWMPGSRFLDR
jgi:hypothetical protein